MTATEETTPPARTRSGARTKGIVAIAAGTALLLGGAGTYALWTTSIDLGSGTIESGDLGLSLGTAQRTLDGLLTGPLPIDPAALNAVRIVPGDVLELTQPVTVTLVGDTIEADLTVDAGTAFASGDVAPYIDVALEVNGSAATDNTYRVTPDTAGTLTATVTITFDEETPGLDGTLETIDLAELGFTLTQAE
jgi:alternate signal-mediated exported protein